MGELIVRTVRVNQGAFTFERLNGNGANVTAELAIRRAAGHNWIDDSKVEFLSGTSKSERKPITLVVGTYACNLAVNAVNAGLNRHYNFLLLVDTAPTEAAEGDIAKSKKAKSIPFDDFVLKVEP